LTKDFNLLIRQYIPPPVPKNVGCAKIDEKILSLNKLINCKYTDIPTNSSVEYKYGDDSMSTEPMFVNLLFATEKGKDGKNKTCSKHVALFLPRDKLHGWLWTDYKGKGCKGKFVQVCLI
jgi:hypothetical protein